VPEFVFLNLIVVVESGANVHALLGVCKSCIPPLIYDGSEGVLESVFLLKLPRSDFIGLFLLYSFVIELEAPTAVLKRLAVMRSAFLLPFINHN